MKRVFKNILHSFPFQLLLLNLKRHQVLLLFWVVFFLTITNQLYSIYGVPFLFLDPEYLGQGGYISFAWVGLAFGAFVVTWNLVLYILNSFRFRFLASLRYPLFTFSLNNAFVPLLFITVYLISVILFQRNNEFVSTKDLVFDIAGFFAGFITMVFINAAYFQFANNDIIGVLKNKKRALKRITRSYQKNRSERFVVLTENEPPFFVRSYLTGNFKIRLARNVEHYDKELLNEVFQQHHWNAVLLQCVSLLTLIILGIFIEVPLFQLPSAANIFFAFASFASIYGLFKFWSGRWSTTAFLVIFVLMNLVTKYSYLTYQSRAIGLDFNKAPREYSNEALAALASEKNCNEDIQNMDTILEHWKEKNSNTASKKPKIVFVCASGGGLRAAMFAMATLQKIDSISNGGLMKQTFLMTGASGGMQGVSYFRELYYRSLTDPSIHLSNRHYTYNVAKDLINALTASITTNDLFFPWRALTIGNNTYKKDRGYMWEYQFNRNCENMMDRSLGDYVLPEKKGQIPLMLTYPVLTNDARFLFIASQPMRFMMMPYDNKKNNITKKIDGIDYLTFFEDYQALKMPLVTSIRLNATYPWILPNAVFPSTPEFTVMDAGIRDNYGTSIIVRFVNVFKKWIDANTSGVVIVEMRAYQKFAKTEEVDKKSWLAKVSSPFGTIGNNLANLHDYNNDELLSLLDQNMNVPLSVVRFEYSPHIESDKTSLSFRLTSKEKEDILQSTHNPENASALKCLLQLLENKKESLDQ